MSGPAVPGRFSFRFSRQPSCVTVDYTVQARAVEGRPQVKKDADTDVATRRGSKLKVQSSKLFLVVLLACVFVLYRACVIVLAVWPPFVFQASVPARKGVQVTMMATTCDRSSGDSCIFRNTVPYHTAPLHGEF